MKHIVILGAGISGLTTAYALHRSEAFQTGRIKISVLEGSDRFGGKLATEHTSDMLVEHGPDSLFAHKPWALELIEEVGMGDQLIEPDAREFSMLTEDGLKPVPSVLTTFNPAAPGWEVALAYFPEPVQNRIREEADIPPGITDDESIADFFRRRFGRTFSQAIAEPMLAGVHAGDPQRLSMATLYPRYLRAERTYGSLTAAGRQAPTPAPASGRRKSAFLTLRHGMQSLVDRLIEILPSEILSTQAPVHQLSWRNGQVVLATPPGEVAADYVVVALPANRIKGLIADLRPEVAEKLAAIRFVTTSIVTLATPTDIFPEPPFGSGFLVPYTMDTLVTGGTWSSVKWSGRAPEGTLLLRCFIGREGHPITEVSDAELLETAFEAIGSILKPTRDLREAATFTNVDRYPEAMAQYEIGYMDRLREAADLTADLPMTMIGSSFGGNSVADCVRQGREAANQAIARTLGID